MARGFGNEGRAGGDGLKRLVNGDGSRASPFSSRFTERFVNLRDNKSGFLMFKCVMTHVASDSLMADSASVHD